MSVSLSVFTTLAALSVGAAAFAQHVTEKSVAGVTNFKALETRSRARARRRRRPCPS